MSETLLGVVIGGLLSGLGTWITLAVQHRRWATELRITRLQAKRDKLEAASSQFLDELGEAMAANSYPSKMTSDVDFLLPKKASELFNSMMADKEKTDLKMKHYFYGIARALKESLKEIDDEIDAIILGH